MNVLEPICFQFGMLPVDLYVVEARLAMVSNAMRCEGK